MATTVSRNLQSHEVDSHLLWWNTAERPSNGAGTSKRLTDLTSESLVTGTSATSPLGVWHLPHILAPPRGSVALPQVEEVLKSLPQMQVLLPRGGEVRHYLLRHSDLCDLLPAICLAVRERFGTDTQLSLEVYRDSEIEDEYLTLYVRQRCYGPDIVEAIEEIREGYEEKLSGRSGWFLVTTDFRSPR